MAWLIRSARYFALKCRRYSPALILVTIVIVTLFGTVQINIRELSHLGYKKFISNNEFQSVSMATHRELEIIEKDENSKERKEPETLIQHGDVLDLANQAFPKQDIENMQNSAQTIESTNKYPTDGYKRAKVLRNICSTYNDRSSTRAVRVSYDAKYNTLYCPLCKLASTFWTRVFKMVDNRNKGRLTRHPFEVPISQAPASRLYFDLVSKTIGRKVNAKDSFKFLFVRNPYSMLFSAFVDKIVGPNPSFWKVFGSNSCGANISFEQFLRSVVSSYKKDRSLDCHVAKFTACQPCKMNYTFVAKMETFKEDTFHILYKLNQTQTLDVFKEEFSALHANDAIDDSTSGPFSWRRDITKCITWSQALQRIWRKLQIRGIIGVDGFPLTDDEAETISKDQFIALLQTTRSKTLSADRSWLKDQAFKEAYRNVPIDILNDIRNIYVEEFSLFEYNDLPDDIFNRDLQIQDFKLFDYNSIKDNIISKQ